MKRRLSRILFWISGLTAFIGFIYIVTSMLTAKETVSVLSREVGSKFLLCGLIALAFGFWNYWSHSNECYSDVRRRVNEYVGMFLELCGFATIGFSFWAMVHYNPILDRLSGLVCFGVFLLIPAGVGILFFARHIYEKKPILKNKVRKQKKPKRKKTKPIIDQFSVSSSLNGSRRN